MTINFYPERKGTSSHKKLTAYLREKKHTIQYATKFKIDLDKWDSNKQRVTRGHPNALQINSALDRLALDRLALEINAIHKEFLIDKPFAELNQFKAYFKNAITERQPLNDEEVETEAETQVSVLEAFESYLKVKAVQYRAGTVSNYKSLKRLLEEYQVRIRYKLQFHNIDMDFYEGIYKHSVMVNKLANNTIFKYLKNFRTFMKWCQEKGYISDVLKNPLKIKTKGTIAVALSKEELLRLYNHSFELAQYSKARDVFCFACFTAGRYSDVASIRREQLSEKYWRYRSPKTAQYITVPLQPEAKAILAKYAGDAKPLPIINAYKTNADIKAACKEAQIDSPCIRETYIGGKLTEQSVLKYEMISFHTARRTFATLAMNAGKSPAVVMKITGHSSIATLMKYIKTTAEQVDQEFEGSWF